jgi:hypothetical protein
MARVSPTITGIIYVLIHKLPLKTRRNFHTPHLSSPLFAGAELATSIGGNPAAGTSPFTGAENLPGHRS